MPECMSTRECLKKEIPGWQIDTDKNTPEALVDEKVSGALFILYAELTVGDGFFDPEL